MSFTPIDDVLAEAERRGLRRAFFVTALMVEMDAVMAHMEPFAQVKARNGEVYECGIFRDVGQDWLVVVVESGAGNNRAQAAVTMGHMLFHEFEVQVFVGVGGSRKADDAPLGTVVASDHVYFPYSGKYGEKGWSGRPHSFAVDTNLVALAKYIRRQRTWPSRIRPPVDGRLPPENEYPVAFPPKAHVAPIISVEAVLADPNSELEARIAEDYGDACVVEMEGYGATFAASQEHTPGILVRGVSDMTQGKTGAADQTLQPIAAAHAAAFAFELLSQWSQAYSDPTAQGPARRRPALAVESPRTPAAAGRAEPVPAAETPASEVVLNLDVNQATVDEDEIGRLQADLRAVAGTDDIEVLGTEPGSLRVIVRDPTGALAAVSKAKLREALSERGHAELLGMVDRSEFDRLKAYREDLALASVELLAWPRTLPDGEWIERPELSQLLDRIDQSVGSTTVLLGDPGAGKTALMSQLVAELQDRGWPVLGIKADLLDPEIATEVDLKHRLNLPDLPSALLERLAQFQPVVLVIDQLDALAGYLDMRTARLSVLLNLVRRVGRHDNVHIVLSARVFEFNHDVRLKTVNAEATRLDLPGWSQVLAILESHGVMAAGWPDDAQQVMRSPQALATYLALDRGTEAEVFTSYQLMLDRLWTQRVLGAADGASLSQLACRLADEMAEEESLWLPTARFDAETKGLEALIAAGILTPDQSGLAVGFTHQTLFDYTLSRGFAREHGRLSRFVLERQNSLFLRPKLWAALTYLRGADPAAYLAELETIWRAPVLREHLRLLIIEFLGQQVQPTPREILVMEDALTSPLQRVRGLRAMAESPGWFEQFKSSAFADAMSDPALADALTGVLSLAWPFAGDGVVDLLQEHWAPDAANDNRLWHTLQAAPRWTEAMLSLACLVVSRTDVHANFVDHVAATIGVEQPDLAMRLVRAKLDHDLKPALAEMLRIASARKPTFETEPDEWHWHWDHDPRKPIDDLMDRSQAWGSLPALAEQDPPAFFAILWPWYVEAFDAVRDVLATHGGGYLGYALPYEFDFRFDGEDNLTLPDPHLLGAAGAGAVRWAATDPVAFLAWAKTQEAYDLRPVHRLIAYAMRTQPEVLAGAAFDYLIADSRRFYLGPRGNQDTTLRLIDAAAPFWTEAQVRAFEAAVAAFNPPPPDDGRDVKQRRGWRTAIRRIKLDLLRALPKHQRSAAVDRQVEQEERRFGRRVIGEGKNFRGGFIGSAMDADAMARSSDEDIINAFNVLPDATEWSHPKNWEVGGNIQLAREFATFAKDYPDRAARIIAHLTQQTGTRAAGYALDAMAETAGIELIISVLTSVVERGFDGDEFRGSVSRAVERLVNRDQTLPDPILALLEGWLAHPLAQPETEPANEDAAETARTKDSSGDDTLQRSLLWGYGGVSILPGGDYPVLEALTRARLARREHDVLMDTLEAYLEHGRDGRVWDNLFRLFNYICPSDPARRTRFVARLFDLVPALVGTKAASQFVANAAWSDLAFVDDQLDRWKALPTRVGRQAYGEIVGLVAVLQPIVAWAQTRLTDLIADPNAVDARAGATLSAANLWVERKTRHEATKLILRTLPVGEAGIWVAAVDVFRLMDGLTPDVDTVEFLTCLADHLPQAPQLGPHFIVEKIATLLPHRAELVGRLAQGLVSLWRSTLGDIRTAHALAAMELVDLAVTLHRLGPETREIGSLLFEELILLDAYEARSALDEIDNRFRRMPPIQRRRLQRASSAPRKQRGRRPAA